jgi:hypothetical protein
VQIQTTILPTTPSTSPQQNTTGKWILKIWIIIIVVFSLEFPQFIALFPYEAQQDDELGFPADAVLEILDQGNTSGWFKARLGDQVGLIPSTYVQPIDTQPQRK